MIKEILTYPNPVLRKKSKPVVDFDAGLQQIISDMTETMFDAPGVGLAAPQIGISKRIIVVNTTEKDETNDDEDADIEEEVINKQSLALINPEIFSGNGNKIELEGCLSVPEFSKKVKRFVKIKVKAFDPNGKELEFEAEDFFARIIQHEIDHLDGILFVDRMSFLSRNRYKKRFKFKTIRANSIPNL